MYTALYRAYRPETFDEILGQEYIVRILKNQIQTDSTSHAYLFCGTRGTGKTTTARILAKGLNCLSEGDRPCGHCSACRSIKEGTFIDVMEIDAASNNGVDSIRELRESVKYPPAAGRKKVYIIDEVHMLSTGAFNALLKTLEEPPEYVVFILATTEPQKLPATILSRCMRLDFKRVPETVLIKGMEAICEKQGIEVSESALRIIAANSDGSVRDGLSILDQCISGGQKSIDGPDVLEFLGASGEEIFAKLTDHVRKGETSEAMMLLAEELEDGKDVRQFIRDWINHYRNLLMTKFISNPQDIINMSVENIDRIRRQSEIIELVDINDGIRELSKTLNDARWSTQPRILLELAIVKLSTDLMDEPAPARRRREAAPVKRERRPEPEREEREPEPPVMREERMEELPEAVHERETPEAEAAGFDYDIIWDEILDTGSEEKGSFTIMRNGSRLTSINGSVCTVSVDSPSVAAYADRNKTYIEELLTKQTGKEMAIHLVKPGDGAAKADGGSFRDTVTRAEELLGIDIEIKE